MANALAMQGETMIKAPLARWTCRILVALASVPLVVPPTWAQSPPAGRPPAAAPMPVASADVALTDQGLRGVVLDSQGVGQSEAPVLLVRHGQVLGQTTTDAHGEFVVPDVSGGSYLLATPGGLTAVRAWAPQTAPPSARHQALLVSNPQTVRGQWPIYNFYERIEQQPLFWYTVFAAMIVVPIVTITADDDAS